MKRAVTALGVATALLIAVAPALEAQSFFFPDYALPSMADQPTGFLAASYGRGLNDASGKVDAYGVAYGRSMESFSFALNMGAADLVDTEITAGGSIAVDVMQGESATISLQGGVGWISFDVLTTSTTSLRFPIGVAIKGAVESPEARITPWVMPRLNVARTSAGGASTTSTDFGASGGVGFTFASGFGVHTALDVLVRDGGQPWTFMMGAHYVLGGS